MVLQLISERVPDGERDIPYGASVNSQGRKRDAAQGEALLACSCLARPCRGCLFTATGPG